MGISVSRPEPPPDSTLSATDRVLQPRAAADLPAPGARRPWPMLLSNVARLLPLVLAGIAVWLGWSGTWLLSYRLTQGNDFTYTFLTSYDDLWWRLYDTLTLVSTFAPSIEPPQDLQTLVTALVVAFGVASVGYLAGVVLLDSGFAAVRGALVVVWLITLGGHVILFLLPGTYTTDIFSYVLYGNIAGVYGANPYIVPPNAFPDDPILDWINPIWHAVPSVYGPLWTAFSVPLARAVQPLELFQQVLVYRGLMNLAQLLNDVLVWFLLGRLLVRRSASARLGAFVLFAWNPVMLFEVAGNAHNDGFMVTWLLLGLVPLALLVGRTRVTQRDASLAASPPLPPSPARRGGSEDHAQPSECAARRGGSEDHAQPSEFAARRAGSEITRKGEGAERWAWALGLVLLTLGALVKYTSAVLGLFLLVVWVRRLPGLRLRVLWVGATALVAGAVTLGLFWPWLDGPATLSPILVAAGGRYHMNSLTDLATLAFADRWLDPIGLDRELAEATARGWAKTVTWSAFALYIGWEAWRLWRAAGRPERTATAGQDVADDAQLRDLVQDVLGASVRAFLVLLLLVFTWVWAWYFTWPLALAALRGWRDTLARVAVGYTLTSLPIFYIHHYLTSDMPDWFLAVYALAPLLVPLWAYSPLAKRTNHLDQVVRLPQRA